MSFNWFVIPFAIGFHYMLAVLLISLITGFNRISTKSKKRLLRRIFSRRIFNAINEVIMESLLHRKLFKINTLLGFMHTTFAFGWFLLIAIGKVETHILTQSWINPVWVPIFLRRGELFDGSLTSAIFANTMDFLLLCILAALLIAIGKRFVSKAVGMKNTTQHQLADNLALSFLWAIFPLRFLAESAQAGIAHNGGFLTQTAGNIITNSFPITQSTTDIFWWCYSIALGGFFAMLPYSRYLHIPAEIVLIFARNLLSKAEFHHPVLRQLENNSCSRCGVCLDACVQRKVRPMDKNQSVYLLRSLRRKPTGHGIDFDLAFNCLQCNKCSTICPVGINLMPHRNFARGQYSITLSPPLQKEPLEKESDPINTDVLYFEGCMGRLNHRTNKAMKGVFGKLNLKYYQLDNSISCCGRGANLMADKRNIKDIMAQNSEIINRSNAKMLVTSCPICYKSFKENYALKIPVLHHSQLIAKNFDKLKIATQYEGKSHYHTPCELGKNEDIATISNKIGKKLSAKIASEYNLNNSICCGGSIANLTIEPEVRKAIGQLEIDNAINKNATCVVTSCPLCKRSLAKLTNLPVMDISETLV